MKIRELKSALAKFPESTVRFVLPNGSTIPIHAHVTDVARIDKRFVDCGGTFREESLCRLQTWVADDLNHRLNAEKLLKILNKAKPVLISDELEVDVEHEVQYISQFPVASVSTSPGEVQLHLTEKHTACLAQDQCCPPSAENQCCVKAPEILGFPTLKLPALDKTPVPTV